MSKNPYLKVLTRGTDGNYEMRFSFGVKFAPEYLPLLSSDLHDFKEEILERAESEWEATRLDFLSQLFRIKDAMIQESEGK